MISVIIPAYNTALLIQRTIHSVLNQKNVSDFEIIVVDDCSTDHTPELVSSFNDPRIRFFSQSENHGPAAARNRGLAEAKGEFIAFLDGDDYWEDEFLYKTGCFLREHPEAVAVSVMQCHKHIGKKPSIVPAGTGIETPVVLEDFNSFWSKHFHVCTGSVLMRGEIARRLGGQREDLRICEDLEFWLLLASQGKWGLIPEVLFTSDGGIVTQAQGWLEKNRKRWDTAPSVIDWERRITAQYKGKIPGSFAAVRGRIARNLCYCHIMADKIEMARQEVILYGKNFPRTKINMIFRIMAAMNFSWRLFCKFLKKREFAK